MRAQALRGELPDGAARSWDAQDPEEVQIETYLMFRLGLRIFAVNVRFVREVLVVCEILPLPNAPADVLGVIDLRNQGIAIVDLASRLGMVSEQSDDARIVVFEIEHEGKLLPIGIVADHVLRVNEVPDEDIEPVARTGADWQGDRVEGAIRCDEGIALILQVEKLLVTAGCTAEH